MKRRLSSQELARDERFSVLTFAELGHDERRQSGGGSARLGRCRPDLAQDPDSIGATAHHIFSGELEALEAAGRTCWDFDTGTAEGQVPFDLKLAMARQCWDESRHCEIATRVLEWTGTAIGGHAEVAVLFEAACNRDPVLRLAGVNRSLEGLAIDIFNAMRSLARSVGDPLMEFCEDWMLADEVTHVKMGSDWLRALTEDDPARRERALRFQRVIDSLFSTRGAIAPVPIGSATQLRELAGLDPGTIDELDAGAFFHVGRSAASGPEAEDGRAT